MSGCLALVAVNLVGALLFVVARAEPLKLDRMDNRYTEKRRAIEEVFSRYSRLEGEDQEYVSPSGLYQLCISHHGVPGEVCWEYSRGIVRRLADRKILADVKRNIGHFWHAWVDHPNGNEYLLLGEDYQGYSVVNLTEGQYKAYFPEAGYIGNAFCWAAVYPSPDKLVLAVDGCLWACPYELAFYDFRTPDVLPYKKIGKGPELTECTGWLDNETFLLKREVEFRKSDGIPYEQLSDEEQMILDADSSLVDYRNEDVEVRRPFYGDASLI